MANPVSSADDADIGKNNYDSLNNARDNDEADVPEGLNAISPTETRNVGSEKRDQTTVFDGYGNYVTPYSTNDRYINRRWIAAHIHFYTQQDEYDAYYVLGRKDYHKNHEGKVVQLTNHHREYIFDGELMSLDTENDGTKGMPTMQAKLFGYRDWEQILRPNDYVAAQIDEKYPDSPDEPEKLRTIMTGLISDIGFTEDSRQDGRVYTITCQGMQKVLSNIWLGLPKTAMVNNVNLIFDEYGASNPANESFLFGGGGSSGPSKSSSPKGSAKEIGGKREKEAISWCNSHGLNINQTAGLLANMIIESGHFNTENYLGVSYGNVGSDSDDSSDVGSYLNHVIFHVLSNGSSNFSKYKGMKSKSAYDCAAWWSDNVEHPTPPDNNDSIRGHEAQSLVSQLK